jgi:hypothetical protein
MRYFSRRLVRVLLSGGLALLFTVLAVFKVPQSALGYVTSSWLSQGTQISGRVAVNTPDEAIAQFQDKFTCLKTEQIPINNFSAEPTKIREIVRRLAKSKDFRECINNNGITGVDPETLIGVIFTSTIVDKFGLVVVGAGPRTASQSAKIADPLPGSNNNGAPNNGIKVIITNAQEIDGKAMQIGDPPVQVKIKALGKNNQDLSNIATLENSQGQIIGKGATINYTPSGQPKNECLTAKVNANGLENWYTVCFTVSSKEIELEDNIKVFDDPQQADNLLVFDTDNGITCFRDDAKLGKKLKVGDKIVPFFHPLPDVPTIMANELVIPPVKLGDRIEPKNLNLGNNFPDNAICYQSSVILDWTELVKKAQINHEFPEVDFSNSPGFSRIVDDNDHTIGFNDIKEGWVDGLADNLQDLFSPVTSSQEPDSKEGGPEIPFPNNCKEVLNELGQYVQVCEQGQLRTSRTQRLTAEDFGTGEYAVTLPKNYQIRLTMPLIDEPNQEHQRPGKSNTRKPPKCTQISNLQQGDKAFSATAFLGLNLQPNATAKSPINLKNFKLDVNILKQKNLADVTFEGEPTVDIIGGITMNGSYNLACEEEWILYEMPTPIVIPLAPLPLWIQVAFSLPLTLNADFNAALKDGFLGLKINASSHTKMVFDVRTGFIRNGENVLKDSIQSTKVSISPLSGGEINAQGKVKLTLEPTFKFLIESIAGPAIGFAGNVQADVLLNTTAQEDFTRLRFVHWYEVKAKLSENGLISKFDDYLSGINAIGKAAKQICSLDEINFKDKFLLKDDTKISFNFKKAASKGFNTVKDTVGKPVQKAVKTVGKEIKQGAKKLEVLPRKLEASAGKIVPKEIKQLGKKVKGFCTQITKYGGIDIKQWVMKNTQLSLYRYPSSSQYRNVVCENIKVGINKTREEELRDCPKIVTIFGTSKKYALKLGEKSFPKPKI